MIPAQTQEKISQLLEDMGYEIYDIAFTRDNDAQILRVFISHKDNPKESVTLDDCQKVSLLLSPLLDVELPTMQEYFLEVSSPGIQRVLKTLRHFEGAVGELVRLKLCDKREIKGRLEEVTPLDNGSYTVTVDKHTFSNGEIKKAQTYFQWNSKGKI